MHLQTGSRLGPYEILAPLGAGGMGEVYRARDTNLSREVAIKVMPAAVAADPERLARFRREAQTLAALNHPNIAAIYGLEMSEGSPCLVLELVHGETLASRLQRGALAVPEALVIGAQIAAAIEAAHERGIVHRDLKPGNIMLTTTQNATLIAKVLDFGLAKSDPAANPESSADDSPTITAYAGATQAGVILGTAAYMSPEQARGRAVDRRSDVWSFGCVLYECLTGRMAFTGQTTSDLIARILEREPDWALLPAATPQRVRDLLKRCLRKDLESRPRDIRDVRLELTELATGGGDAMRSDAQSVAVLPFENLSGADDEYFADGVTEEILNALAHVEGLRVAARTSCFAFKGKREDLRTVGEKLDVATVLEGSVRRAGARLRITVQLVKVADGYQLWSERYDRELTDVFEVQEEIANAITMRLRGTLHEQADRTRARAGTKNLEAYELFLRGRALQTKRGRFMPQAIACFHKAIALDPGYAEAMAWLADHFRVTGTFGSRPFGEVMPKAREWAQRALAIDDSLAEAWSTLACVAQQFDWDYAKAEPLWDKVFALDPGHGRGRCQRALWAYTRERATAAASLVEADRAMHDEPLSAWVVAMRSHLLGFIGSHGESVSEAERGLQLDPDSFFAQWNLMRAYAWAGHHERALAEAPILLTESGRHHWVLGTLAWTHGQRGDIARAGAVHEEMLGRSKHEFLSPSWLAVSAYSAGRADEAFTHLAESVQQHDPLVVWSRCSPFHAGSRSDPRFAQITRGIWE